MEEKTIIESKRYNLKNFVIAIAIIAVLCSAVLFINVYKEHKSNINSYKEQYQKILTGDVSKWDINCMHGAEIRKYVNYTIGDEGAARFKAIHPEVNSYLTCAKKYHGGPNVVEDILFPLIPCSLILIALLLYFWMGNCSVVVSDKRVYGKTAFGRRVDLPMDSISAVGLGAFKSITVATSSGKNKFLFIRNRDSIHAAINDLLVKRQPKQAAATPVVQQAAQSAADELKKYKELLDSGVITQEEFDAKKKQLLGL